MILITGNILAKPDTFKALLEVSLDHVRRSRSEPGCIAHNVHVDCENPLKLVFVEKWQDQAAVAAHFRVEGSSDFVVAARNLAAQPPVVELYDTTALPFG